MQKEVIRDDGRADNGDGFKETTRFLGVQGRDCHGYHLETKAFTFHPPVFSVISRVTSIGL